MTARKSSESVLDTPDSAGLEERVERLELEKSLFLGLLDLGEIEEPASFMDSALTLVTRILRAERGYLELSDPETDGNHEEGLFIAAGCSDEEVAHIQSTISRGIIAHSVAQGKAVSVPSALLDPRFKDNASVKRSQIESVLCVPIGQNPPLGVLYVQGRLAPGPFSPGDVERAEVFSRHLLPVAQRFFQRRRRREREDPTRELRQRMRLDGVIGESPAMAHLLREVELAAPLDVSLLITGDTGTGKSQLARVIHNNSSRKSGPFVEINCAAIPETLMESELFGALPGAHSTAKSRIQGKVSAAEAGTLFLDEITELSLTAQAKLLQLLQTKEYYPLGAPKAQRANVRVIAATNVELGEAIREQDFREDLYYRLQVLPLRLPALAERREDIPALAQYFCDQAASQHGLRSVTLSTAARRALVARDWPGNVRELLHVVEVGAIRAAARGGELVEDTHLFPGSASAAPSSPVNHERLSFQEETRRFQAQLLADVLREQDWNIASTARQLRLTRAHVYNLIKAFGLGRE